jgi:hypothetical protein
MPAVPPVPPSVLGAAAAYRLRDRNLLPAEAARIRRRSFCPGT